MWRTIATVFVCLLIVVLAIGIVFLVGMRTSPRSCSAPFADSTGPSGTHTR